jgi:hypothetical protein
VGWGKTRRKVCGGGGPVEEKGTTGKGKASRAKKKAASESEREGGRGRWNLRLGVR